MAPFILERLVHHHFSYHEEGYLIWKNKLSKSNRIQNNSIAGTIETTTRWNKNSYREYARRRVGFYGKNWLNSNLIWIYHHGIPIPKYIDHIDGNTLNDKIENLRSATASENLLNQKNLLLNNTLGFVGVVKQNGKYIAKIGFNNKKLYLGTFSSIKEAAEAYDKAAIELYKEFSVPNTERKI